MRRYYIPYSGKKPSAVEINGHRLIVLSQDKEAALQELDTIGADRLKVVKVDDSADAEHELFMKLASKNDAGIVVLPSEIRCRDLLNSLEDQLPWMH